MNQTVLAAVLAAALIDATQHCLIKSGANPFVRALYVAMAGGVLAAPLLTVTGLPAAAAWPLLAVSITLGSLYWLTLGWAYRGAALALVFPLSRGTGVVLTALGGRFIFRDRLTQSQGLMLTLILVGIFLVILSLRTRSRSALASSLCLALLTAAFTLVDAAGVRLSGSPPAYCLTLYLGNALVVACFTLPRPDLRLPRAALPSIALSALFSLTAYALILYGLAHGPVAVVAALAETSIVFAALMGIFWLREGTTPRHALGLTVIALGVVLLRLDFWPAT